MLCEEIFQSLYKKYSVGLAFCPYRICPLGAHIDHQYGKITGLALDKGIYIAYEPKKNGVIELSSLNFEKRAQFHVNAVPPEKQNDWADYLRGVTVELGNRYTLRVGMAGVIEGSLPIGGLSSSAAVILSFLTVLCSLNDIKLTDTEMIEMAQHAENNYVGVAVGTLDQSCEVLCKKNHLLYLDAKDGSYELIPQAQSMKPYDIAIFFSGVERCLLNENANPPAMLVRIE